MDVKSVKIVRIDDAEFHFREPRLDEAFDPDNAIDPEKLKARDPQAIGQVMRNTFTRLVKVVNVKIDGEELTPEGARQMDIPQSLAIQIINELYKETPQSKEEAEIKN